MFTKPANLLILDEPTNDLDIESLELLEELLINYKGTLIIVSHDRSFLDNVITSTLIFEGKGKISEYVGGYQDWLNQVKDKKDQIKVKIVKDNKVKPKLISNKISYNEQRELSELPNKIEILENKLSILHDEISSTEFYQQTEDKINQKIELSKQFENDLQQCYERWENLEQ
jgi:ATP-binding cassette subfamily F protein uup